MFCWAPLLKHHLDVHPPLRDIQHPPLYYLYMGFMRSSSVQLPVSLNRFMMQVYLEISDQVSPAPPSIDLILAEHEFFGCPVTSCLSETLGSPSLSLRMTTKAWSVSLAWWRQDTASPCVFPSRSVPFMDKMLSPLWIVPSRLAAPLVKTRWTWTWRVTVSPTAAQTHQLELNSLHVCRHSLIMSSL